MLTFVVVERRWAEKGGCRAALEVSVDFQSGRRVVAVWVGEGAARG